MQKNKVFQVLSPCRELIKILDVFVDRVNWSAISLNTLFTFTTYIVSFGAWITTLLFIWFCFDREFNLTEISLPMTFSMGSIQMLLVLVFMIKNKKVIIETIDLLQDIVEQRKWKLFCVASKINFKILFFYSIFRVRKIIGKVWNLWEMWTKINFYCEIYFKNGDRNYNLNLLSNWIVTHPICYYWIPNSRTVDNASGFCSVNKDYSYKVIS